ncbi:MAG TPA: MoaD/ThiS family protein [Candidatus Eisenbacteria bacterium]|nr:MoaD/ThiS family protein [Candidatus Eisenbacteria bacterium]
MTLTRRGALAHGHDPSGESVTLAEGARAADLLAACGVDPRTCIVVVNGAAVVRQARLGEGDRVQIYPAQAGG